MRKVLRLIFIVPILLVLAAIIILIVATTPEDRPKPTPRPPAEKDVTLHDLRLHVPEAWQVETKNGIARAYGCAGSACGEIQVYGEEALKKVNWQWEKIVRGYACQGNEKNETSGPIKKQPQTVMIGNRGAYRATMERCNVSNTETLEIWHTQMPPRLIVADRRHSLPNLDDRLKAASWTT